MAGKLTASFILKLEDQLSAGLAKIEKQFTAIAALGKKLGLGAWEDGTKTIDAAASAAKKMAANVSGVTSSANQARNALGRFSGVNQVLSQGASAAAQMAASVSAVGRSANFASGAMARLQNLRASAGRVAEHVGVLGGAAAGLAVLEPIRAYASQENTLRHIAITEKKSGPAVETEVGRLDDRLNKEALATGQNSVELAKAYNFLITTGMSSDEVDRLMPAHAQAATAYNISSDSMGQAVFALADTLKIQSAQMPAALASMAYAAKEGHFSVEDFSHFLPTVSASVSKLGMTGRGAADTTFAALETVRKSTGDAGTAATDLKDMLDYIVSPFGAHSFAKAGIDLPDKLRKAEKQGVNPLDAVLGELSKMTAGKTPVETAQILGTVFHNQQARDAALALLQHQDVFTGLRKKFGAVDKSTIDTDFQSAFRAPEVQMRLFGEELAQLNRRLGQGFAPVMMLINKGLDAFIHAMNWLDLKVPGLSDKLLAMVAGFLLLVAALGTLGIALPAIGAAFELIGGLFALLASPVVVVVLAALSSLALIAYDIIDNWSTFLPFFRQMWKGIEEIFQGAVLFLAGAFNLDFQQTMDGIELIWKGFEDLFGGSWSTIKQLFTDFGAWVDGWANGAWTEAINAIVKPFQDAWNEIANSPLGHLMGLAPALPVAGAGHEDGDGVLSATPAPAPAMAAPVTLTIDFKNMPVGVNTSLDGGDPGHFFVKGAPLSPFGPPNAGRTLMRP